MPDTKSQHQSDTTVPDVPADSLYEDEYGRQVRRSLEEIVGRFKDGRASKIEVETTIVAYFANVAVAQVHDFDGQLELKPWFEQLESDACRYDSASQRGREFTLGRDQPEKEVDRLEDNDKEEEGDDEEEHPAPSVHSKRPRGDSSPAGSDPGSGDERPERKRRRAHSAQSEEQDASLFGWASAASAQLTPAHRKVRDAVENHRRDIKNAMRSLLRSGVAPVFPQHLWEKVLLDEPVDFDEINGFFFSFSTKLDVEEKKTVNTAVAWLRCFDKYSEAVETVFPYRAAELRAWRRHIDDLFTAKVDESHIRVIAYDIAARKVIGSSPAILFNQCDARELVTLRMVSAAYNDIHGTGGGAKSTTTKSGKRREICNNWNKGTCPRHPCPRRHVCSSCEGLHVSSTCKAKGN